MANSTENISAFAFQTGKQIEDIIDIRTNFLRKQNEELQYKIFDYHSILKSEDNLIAKHFAAHYAKYFGITTLRHGEIESSTRKEGEE